MLVKYRESAKSMASCRVVVSFSYGLLSSRIGSARRKPDAVSLYSNDTGEIGVSQLVENGLVVQALRRLRCSFFRFL